MNRQPRDIGASFRVSDALWERIRPLLPAERPKPKGGRPPTMIARCWMASSTSCGPGFSGKPCHGRSGRAAVCMIGFKNGNRPACFANCGGGGAGVRLRPRNAWEWQAIDGAITKAPLGGAGTGPNPTDRGKSGTKRSLLTDGCGVPLGVAVAGANRDDMTMVRTTLETQSGSASATHAAGTAESVPGQRLRFRRGPRNLGRVRLHTAIRARGEETQAKQHVPGYRARRWVVERTHSWMNRFRRLLIRWEKKVANYLAMLEFA